MWPPEPMVTVTLKKNQVALLRRLVKKRMENIVDFTEGDMETGLELDMLDDLAVVLVTAS